MNELCLKSLLILSNPIMTTLLRDLEGGFENVFRLEFPSQGFRFSNDLSGFKSSIEIAGLVYIGCENVI